ncbi:hypothetical protein F4861DRAFT_525702 [Xylaria intraflava]|nr:hypothetical protein F4861DRAFT_525702 [Xylaria intraflava]
MRDLPGLRNVTFLTVDVVKPGDIESAINAVSEHDDGNDILNFFIGNTGRSHFMLVQRQIIEEQTTNCLN